MSMRTCIMGCSLKKGQATHGFPVNAKRRAEWCRILGIYPKTKKICICSAHFSKCYMFGNRLTRYAVPNPPESRKTNPEIEAAANSMYSRIPNQLFPETEQQLYYDETWPQDDSIKVFPTNEQQLNYEETGAEIIVENVAEEPLQDSEDFSFMFDNKDEATTQQTEEKVEDFEIRKGSTNDMIIKGRYVQTKDYLVVSYTPPRKWSLQEQVEMLDKKCEQQLNQIKKLNKEKYRLHRELKKHEMLLPQIRRLQMKNLYFYSQLKMYKQKEARLKKRRKERRQKMLDVEKEATNAFDAGGPAEGTVQTVDDSTESS